MAAVFIKPRFPFSFNKIIHIRFSFRFPSYGNVIYVHVYTTCTYVHGHTVYVKAITFYFRGSLPLLPPQVRLRDLSLSLLSPSPFGFYFRNNNNFWPIFLPCMLLFSNSFCSAIFLEPTPSAHEFSRGSACRRKCLKLCNKLLSLSSLHSAKNINFHQIGVF